MNPDVAFHMLISILIPIYIINCPSFCLLDHLKSCSLHLHTDFGLVKSPFFLVKSPVSFPPKICNFPICAHFLVHKNISSKSENPYIFPGEFHQKIPGSQWCPSRNPVELGGSAVVPCQCRSRMRVQSRRPRCRSSWTWSGGSLSAAKIWKPCWLIWLMMSSRWCYLFGETPWFIVI